MSACRWPEKNRHASKAAAKAAIGALYAAGKGSPDMAPYPCGDHWHIGHDVTRFKARIRRSLAGGRGPSTLYARNRRRAR